MEIVIVYRAIGQRLLYKFACGCGGSTERISHKSEPAQRQQKEKDCVLTKESETVLWHGNNRIIPDPTKGYTGDYPLCVLLVTFRTNEKSPQRSVRGGRSKSFAAFSANTKKGFRSLTPLQIFNAFALAISPIFM